MIKKLLIFEKSGICLFSKDYCLSLLEEDDELVTGFLSVLFGFLDAKFGILNSIHTTNNVLLITAVQDVYIMLVIERIESLSEGAENDRCTLLNKRLENACKSLLNLIERKVGTLLIQLRIRKENDLNYRSLFSNIGSEFESIISHGMRKIQVIKKVFEKNPITNVLEI